MLGPDYEDLSGEALLGQLVVNSRFDILKAFWRHGEEEIAAALVGPMASSGHPPLVDLLVDEMIEAQFGEPVPSRLVTTLNENSAPATDGAVARLCQHLRQAELDADYDQYKFDILNCGHAMETVERLTGYPETRAIRGAVRD